MLKYCFSNGCPCDEEKSCIQAAGKGHLDCLRFLFGKVKPSRDTEKEVVIQAACGGHVEILKYFVEERKIADAVTYKCAYNAAMYGRLDCLKYLVEEAKVPLNNWVYIASLVTTSIPSAKTTCSKKGVQNQRRKNTLYVSRKYNEKNVRLHHNTRRRVQFSRASYNNTKRGCWISFFALNERNFIHRTRLLSVNTKTYTHINERERDRATKAALYYIKTSSKSSRYYHHARVLCVLLQQPDDDDDDGEQSIDCVVGEIIIKIIETTTTTTRV